MMKLVLSLTLILALSSTAGALQCQTCTNSDCSVTRTVTCPNETMCVTASTAVISSGTTSLVTLKLCAPSALCPATGNQTFSTSFGVSSSVASIRCCNTDNCNAGTVTVPAAQTEDNNLKCFTCNGSQCNSTLQCKGDQDRCFQANVTIANSSTPLFGCASANVCTAATNLSNILFTQTSGSFSSEPSCCNTSLCNSASNLFCIRLGLIHLLLGFLIFTLC